MDYREGIARSDLLEIVGGYDAIITRSRTQVDDALIRAAKNLKVIGRGGRTATALRTVIGGVGGRGVRVDVVDTDR